MSTGMSLVLVKLFLHISIPFRVSHFLGNVDQRVSCELFLILSYPHLQDSLS